MNKNMLGYDLNTSCEQIYNQYQLKRSQTKKTYHDEIDLGYMVVSDPLFISTYHNNTVQAWQYLKKSMVCPPKLLIDHCSTQSQMTLS